MSEKLERYRRMRDFSATPEPAGGAPTDAPPGPRFVIQQHDATGLHWDLRLEHDGVLLSWALPRGIPWDPDDNRLAVHTEDHPLEYLDFAGEIPAGQYGAGSMFVWDRGTYEAHKLRDNEAIVTLHGHKVEGRYALFPLDGRDWMIHRMDPPQDPTRRHPPTDLEPMLAQPGPLPEESGWAFEICWSGARVLLRNDGGRLAITGHRGEVSQRFPEVRRLGRALGAVEVILDGVIVAIDQGRPRTDKARIRERLGTDSDSRLRRLADDRPVAVMLVDLLWLEGHSTCSLSYDDRRTLLTELDANGPAWQTPRHHLGDGGALLRVAREQGLDGLVAKLRASPYRPGGATSDWRLITG